MTGVGSDRTIAGAQIHYSLYASTGHATVTPQSLPLSALHLPPGKRTIPMLTKHLFPKHFTGLVK